MTPLSLRRISQDDRCRTKFGQTPSSPKTRATPFAHPLPGRIEQNRSQAKPSPLRGYTARDGRPPNNPDLKAGKTASRSSPSLLLPLLLLPSAAYLDHALTRYDRLRPHQPPRSPRDLFLRRAGHHDRPGRTHRRGQDDDQPPALPILRPRQGKGEKRLLV